MSGPVRTPEVVVYNEGRDFMNKGDLASAITCFEDALNRRVHFKTLELLGECHLKQCRFDKAIIYLAAAVTLNKGVRAASLLATASYESGEDGYRSDTPDLISLVLARDPKNKNALSLKARIEAESSEVKGHMS